MLLGLALEVAAVAIVLVPLRRARLGFLGTRAQALQAGAVSLQGGDTAGIAEDIVYRIDGNAWPAFVLERQATRERPSVSAGLVDDFRLAVPSFLDSSKLATPVWQRNEEGYFDHEYGIPLTTLDWLPTLFGSAFAYGGAVGLIGFALVLGIVIARLDVWLHRGLTFPSLLVGIGAALSITYYERGFDSVLLTMRGALLVWLVARVIGWMREGVRAPAVRVGQLG